MSSPAVPLNLAKTADNCSSIPEASVRWLPEYDEPRSAGVAHKVLVDRSALIPAPFQFVDAGGRLTSGQERAYRIQVLNTSISRPHQPATEWISSLDPQVTSRTHFIKRPYAEIRL